MKATSNTKNILLIIIACLAAPLILAAMQTCSIRLNPDLNDKVTLSWLMEDFLWRNSSCRLECANRCLQKKSCVTFMVDRNQGRCRMYAAKITRYNVLVDAVGFQSYHTCRAKSVLGEVCSANTDCTMLNSICAGNTCQCDYGWSYSPNDLACVKDCFQYGTEFTYFTETFLSLSTTLTLSEPQYISYAGCSTACVNNTAFVCRSFFLNYRSNICTLMNVTPIDDPVSILTGLLPITVDFYQRQCQYVG